MDPVYIISVTPYNITIGWPVLEAGLNGGDNPYYYECEWLNSATNTWVKMINNINGGAVFQYSHVLT